MGCTLSFCQEQVPSRSQSHSNFNKTQDQIYRALRIVQCNENSPFYESFRRFHKVTLSTLIKSHDVHFQKNPQGYTLDIPKDQNENTIYNLITGHINKKNHSIIKDIIKVYNQFLQEIFGLEELQERSDTAENSSKSNYKFDLSITMSNSQVSFMDQRQFTFTQSSEGSNKQFETLRSNTPDKFREVKPKGNEIVRKFLQMHKGLGNAIIYQISEIFLSFRQLVIEQYKKVLSQYFTDSDDFQAREMLLQRIIQTYILCTKTSQIPNVLQPCLQQYYKEQDKASQNMSEQSKSQIQQPDEPQLDCTLIPRNNSKGSFGPIPQFVDESDEQSSCNNDLDNVKTMFDKPIVEEGPEEDDDSRTDNKIQLHNTRDSLKREDMILFLKRSEMVASDAKIPYQETFVLIKSLVNASKLWKKFQLIEKLDLMIIQIFLRSRSQSQYSKLYDHISAEDSKTEILFFILYKYQKVYQVKLETQLYYHLRFMQDFDAVLHKDIKYILCPAFLRFFSILEMLVNYDF